MTRPGGELPVRPRGGYLTSLALMASLALAACGPRPLPSAPTVPKYPDYPYPAVPADLARAAQARPHQSAWFLLQGGDARRARTEFERLVRQNPAFYPSMAGGGFAALAMGDATQALSAFDRALGRAPRYLPAVVGRGEALLALKHNDQALAAFEVALTIDPGLTEVRRRVEILRFRGVEGHLDEARAARRAGQLQAARAAYAKALEASPESALIYRELAEVERDDRDLTLALEHARHAAALDDSDPDTALLIGDLHERLGQDEAALAAYERALSLGAPPDIARRIDAIRRKQALASLPAAYRELATAERVTRGDLAGLIGIRLAAVLQAAPARGSGLVTDARGHWAAEWIPAVARAGIIESLPNHTFQPQAPLRRGELAVVVSRLLAVIARRDPALAAAWVGKRELFSDLGSGHTMYAAASTAVAAGVLDRRDGGGFGPGRPVSGAEALAAIDRVEALAVRAGLGRAQ